MTIVLFVLTFAATAATASPTLVDAEKGWLPTYQAELGEAAVRKAFGRPHEVNVMVEGGKGVLYKGTARFPGGIDFWFDEKGRFLDAAFYVAPIGRMWTRASKLVASKVASRAGMDEVLARYGTPTADKEGKGRRVGVRRLIYEEPVGAATRSVVFGSVPFSNGLHTITVSWERP